MIYAFRHYATANGRRVEFVASLEDVKRADVLMAPDVVKCRPFGSAQVVVQASPGTARILADAFASLGGDAVVAGRMLTEALDGMIDELRASRLTAAPPSASRTGRQVA